MSKTLVTAAKPLPGNYLLPGGLVDARLHLSLDLADIGHPQGSNELIHANWQRQQASGVLAARDAGLAPGVWLKQEEWADQNF